MGRQLSKTLSCAILAFMLLPAFADAASYSATFGEVKSLLKSVGAGMALVLIAYYALNWITSDNPESRVEAKNSIKWIIVGLLILTLACFLTCGILGYSARTYYNINVDCACSI